MNEQEIRDIVKAVLSANVTAASALSCASTQTSAASIPVEASARHVHLTDAALRTLFGAGATLEKKRDLSQPGEFLSDKRVKLVTKKGEIANVAVLGPVRNAVQVELSITDCRSLGLEAPINLSGDLKGAADVLIIGEAGMLDARQSVIVAQSHIHMTPADADRYGVVSGQRVNVRVNSRRPITFENVAIRVKDSFKLAMHLDFDEANACGLCGSVCAAIVNPCCAPASGAPATCTSAASAPAASVCLAPPDKKLITEADAKAMAAQSPKSVQFRRGTIITPAARDVFFGNHIPMTFTD